MPTPAEIRQKGERPGDGQDDDERVHRTPLASRLRFLARTQRTAPDGYIAPLHASP